MSRNGRVDAHTDREAPGHTWRLRSADGGGSPAPPPRWGWARVTAVALVVGSGVGAFGWLTGQWSLALLLALAGGLAVGLQSTGKRG